MAGDAPITADELRDALEEIRGKEQRTERRTFAAIAMQGILAGWDEAPAAEIARASVDLADALIDALNEGDDR